MINDLKSIGIEPVKIKVINEDNSIQYIDSFSLLTTTNKGNMIMKNTVQRNWKLFRENLGYE